MVLDNGSGNSDAQSPEQRDSGKDVQLRDRRLTLELVGLEAVPTVWDRFGVGEITRKEEHRAGGRWTADFLFEKLMLEHMQLWLVIENKNGRELIKAAIITDIRPYENGLKVCQIVSVVGEEPRAWIKLKSELEAWAKRSGCEAIETTCRTGWKRVIPDWKQTHIFLEKSL